MLNDDNHLILHEDGLAPAGETPHNANQNLIIVGIGASAGGLEALEQFFSGAIATENLAFVVVQHLSPDYKSVMSELLSKHTSMTVKNAEDGEVVRVNHVYLIPSKKNMTIVNGNLVLSDQPKERSLNFPIDIFFRSLAEEAGLQAVGIILSGTGSDGSKGCKSIKEEGGLVMVQDPMSAKFDGMPQSVIAAGLADYILPPGEMLRELLLYANEAKPEAGSLERTILKNEQALERIIKIIRNFTGNDFSFYKRPTLSRRVAKRMVINKIATLNEYIDILYDSVEERELLSKDFLIGVTKFFRDAEAFKYLETEVIPAIFKQRENEDHIKIWSIGCSTGEEVYSMAILFREYMEKTKTFKHIKFFATDIDKDALEKASKGIYSSDIVDEVGVSRFEKYFTREGDEFKIHPDIRKMIIFSYHNILKNPPFNRLDLVTCRNVLIYFQPLTQRKVLSAIHFALNINGFLFLGPSESMAGFQQSFEELNHKWKIYKNIEPSKGLSYEGLQFSGFRNDLSGNITSLGTEQKSNQTVEKRFFSTVSEMLLEELNAVSICINENFDIVQALGRLKNYIEIPEKGFTNNLLKMLPQDLGIAIGTLVRKLLKDVQQVVKFKAVNFLFNETPRKADLVARILSPERNTQQKIILVNIIELAPSKKQGDILDVDIVDSENYVSQKEQLLELEDALKTTKANLQSTVEELETSNEEMQVTNEELLASNEELQSTNEELQSVNEELHTVNTELQFKNAQLEELHADLNNLLNSTRIATIFLDRQLCIRKFTPAIDMLFNLGFPDIGRPISHFSSLIINDKTIETANKVLVDLQPTQTEVQTKAGNWFLEQIMPYRDAKDHIGGVVISFIEITQQKEVELQINESWAKEKELNELKSRFVSMASHEFRTPLTTILSSTKLITRYEEGSSDHQEKRQKHVKRILGAIHGLNGILDDFLSISRLEEGKIEVRASVESLAHFCQDISELMSSTLKEGQTIQCSHIGKMEFCTDFSILKNIMYNLLSNAVKYSNEGKTIDLMANNRGKVLDIQVTDYGIGIPKAEQAKVFGRFFRAGNATNIQGTGLGLHIVKKYVDMLGGTISFESEPDLQTTFKISLPSIEI